MANQNQVKIIKKDIEIAQKILDKKNIDEIYEYFIKLEGKYEGIKVYTSGAYDYNMREIDYSKFIKFLELFIEKLEQLAAKLQDEDERLVNTNPSNSVTINNNNTNTAKSNITQNISIKSAMEKIDQIPDEIFAKNLKYELKGILSELEYCKDNQEKKSKLMEVVKWLGDKSVDAFIACLPYFAGLGL